MKFMLMMNAPRGDGDWNVMKWPMEAIQAHVRYMSEMTEALQRDGELVAAEGLAPPAQARIVRAGAKGAPEVTDGPFAESKEFLAGYWIVDVETPERAHAIAAQASSAPGKDGKPLRMPIEIREVMSAPPVEP